MRFASSKSLHKTLLIKKVCFFMKSISSCVPQPKAMMWLSLINGSPSSSSFRKNSNNGSLNLMPSSTPSLRHKDPVAMFLTTHSTGSISSLVTRLSFELISSTKCVSIPFCCRCFIINPLNLLFISPLPFRASVFFPSNAEVSSRYSIKSKPSSSVKYNDFAFP